MIKLTAYPANFGEPSASPFCVKSMCMLKASGLAYEVEETADPRKSPTGKLPMLVHDGQLVADSERIRTHIERVSGFDFGDGLNSVELAVSHAIIRMVEEHIYFVLVADRWMNDENWAHVKAAFFSEIPALIRPIVTKHIRKQALAQLKGQGMGLHSEAERFERVRPDLVSVSELLGDKPFLMGDRPTLADYSTVPMLRAALGTPVPTPMSDFIREKPGLVAYLERGAAALYA